MRVCLIAEGCYPYIVGGVSSWVQTLITSMPEHEFIVYTICADEKEKGKFKYKLPSNLIEVREIFLNSTSPLSNKTGKKYDLNNEQKQAIKSLLVNEDGCWEQLFSLFKKGRFSDFNSIAEFVTSKDLFDLVKEVCIESYPELPFTKFYWSVKSMFFSLFSVLSNIPPEADIYHSLSTGYAGIVGAYCKYFYDRPYVLTEHGIYTREREEEIIKSDEISWMFKDLWIEYFKSLSKGAYGSADQVITLFKKNRDIQVEMGCPIEKTTVIPNGVNLNNYSSLPQKAKEDKDIVNIGAVVRVVPIKDIKTMIRSFAIVKREVPNARFYIFGPNDEDTDYNEECLLLVKFLGLRDIQFTGTVDVKQFIGKMDILVLSSISEGQPLVLLEGLACGKPFVCTNVGSCKEVLYGSNDHFGQAGYIVPVMNYVEMARALIKLARNPGLCVTMGEVGRLRMESSYSLANVIKQYRNIYGNRGYMDGGNRNPTEEVG